MFQPVVPLSGIGGWNFLQATYDRQLETFSNSPQIRNDQEYLVEKFSGPLSKEDFLDDQRLLRITMTAFDLGGEEWKRGFIDKVLNEVADPDSTFLARLNNQSYTRFAETFAPQNDQIQISGEILSQIVSDFEAASFESALGEVDNSMRLALNYRDGIGAILGESSSQDAIMFRILGDVPIRSVLEEGLGLPQDIRQLPLERQVEIFQEKLSSVFGINDVRELNTPENAERVIQRFLAISSVNQVSLGNSPAANALTLLGGGGLGAGASQNLFLSLIR